MLVLSRKVGQGVEVGPGIRVRVLRLGRTQVSLGVDAPPWVCVRRVELCAPAREPGHAMLAASMSVRGAGGRGPMLEELERLVAFDAWANGRAMAALRAMETPPPRAVSLLAHVVEAERLWLDRFAGVSGEAAPWPARSLDEIAAELEELEQRWAAFFASATEAGLREAFGYRNTSGVAFESEPGDVVLHLALHGQEHRGQIGLLVGEAGGVWEETQYAWWRRGG